MSDYAYEHGLPCKNPSCKSHGRPHPNCRCYGGLAEGGDVSFCSRDQAHQPDCEYFAEGGAVSFDSLPVDASQAVAPQFDALPEDKGATPPPAQDFDALPDDSDKYGTPGQQAATVAEGLAQGVAGPLATMAELGLSKLGVPGMAAEDIAGRQRANPLEHGAAEATGLIGSLFLGTGEAALAFKAAEETAKVAELGKLGSAVIKGMVGNGLLQAGDEVSNWMLGQGDPQDASGAALAHIGAASLLGGVVGAGGVAVAKGASLALQNVAEQRFGSMAPSFLTGIATASKGLGPEAMERFLGEATEKLPGFDAKAYKKGVDLYNNGIQKSLKMMIPSGSAALGGYEGYREGGVSGAITGTIKGGILGAFGNVATDLVGKGLTRLGAKVVAPTVIRVLQNDSAQGLFQALDHSSSMLQGSNAINAGIDGLFEAGMIGSQQAVHAYGDEEDRAKLDDYIANGGINQNIQQEIYKAAEMPEPQGFAHGGLVKPLESSKASPEVAPLTEGNKGLESHYPEQNILINAAKGRISNYLSGLRPQAHAPKLAFDDEPDQRDQKRSYDKALDIANKPLGILREMQHGTLEADHVKHFKAMYPDIDGLLQKRMTQRIVKAQIAGDKPTYKVRQAMSLYLGTALSAELQPQMIQAAQNVFAMKQPDQPQGQGGAPKKSSASLSKSDSAYLTGNQSLVKRSQRST